MSEEPQGSNLDFKEKYYVTLEQLTAAQSQLLLFQKELAFKERQNRKLSDKIRKLTVGREITDLTPEKDLDFAAFEEAHQGLETLLQPSLQTPLGNAAEMFKVWPSGSITETFDLTTSGKPRKRARKKCRDCHKDDCKGATSGPFGKLLCPEWVANNPQKAAEYQEKMKDMKKS